MTDQPHYPAGGYPAYQPVPQVPPHQMPAPYQPGPPPKRMTAGVWIAMVVALMVIGGTVFGGVTFRSGRLEANAKVLGPQPDVVAAQYLDALLAQDEPAMAALRAERFMERGGQPNRYFGDIGAAKSLDLVLSYDIIKFIYEKNDANLDGMKVPSDASVFVKFTYTMTVEGKPTKAWLVLIMRLSRDYGRVGGELTPTGPWRVNHLGDSMSAAQDLELVEIDKTTKLSGSDYATPAVPKSADYCMDPAEIVKTISEKALQHGVITSNCAAGGEEFSNFEPEVLSYLEETMIPIDREATTKLIELTPVFTIDLDRKRYAPLEQLAFMVEEREFVFTFILIDPTTVDEDSLDLFRLISIVERTKA